MSSEILARWQFGITTVYHFFFVPLTIALSMVVAIFQTLWVRKGDPKYLRLTKFYGKLLLINFAMGVVTGIVQEFQFGMNWSEYSRFVGDIFGAPLALEALLAFFLESTFLGVWIFGWDRLNKKLHLMSIWLAAIGTLLSSIFILAANSFMQHPVGTTYNAERGRAELVNFADMFTNPVFLATFPHTIASAWMVAGGFVAGIAGWHLARLNRSGTTVADRTDAADAEVRATAKRGISGSHAARPVATQAMTRDDEIATWRWAAKFGAWTLLIAGLAVMITGDFQGKVMTDVQPMKMAAAEALYETSPQGEGAPFSVFTVGTLDGKEPVFSLEVPKVLSFLACGNFNCEVKGINDLNKVYTEQFAKGGEIGSTERANGEKVLAYPEIVKEYHASGALAQMTADRTSWTPNVPVSYWTFRLMIGFGLAGMAIGAWILFTLRGGRLPKGGALWNALMWAVPLLPLFAISFGWIFTEMGRQPWLVFGVLPTIMGVSPTVTAAEVLFSMIVYTLLYGGFAVVELGLMWKYVHAGLPEVHDVEPVSDEDAPLSFAY